MGLARNRAGEVTRGSARAVERVLEPLVALEVDVSEPRLPIEVAWFLPPDPTRRYGPLSTSELVVQGEDVLVDGRGFIYISDKNQGIWIVEAER